MRWKFIKMQLETKLSLLRKGGIGELSPKMTRCMSVAFQVNLSTRSITQEIISAFNLKDFKMTFSIFLLAIVCGRKTIFDKPLSQQEIITYVLIFVNIPENILYCWIQEATSIANTNNAFAHLCTRIV
mmetsp:Transcript_3501/g.5267  ORF Transcript_3501/g.5267 Transcript_3501/m.5267 type:complete len:128 (-) Transcript_3501:151-534(-)